jgi:pimeloyl-ACP methyl ester carboxylesterase
LDITEGGEPRVRRIPLASRGGEVAALDFGPEQRPVDIIFLHANGFNARTYRTVLAPLADRRRLLVIDLRGHGRTELPLEAEGRTGWGDIRDDLLALMEAQDIRGVTLSGHSMGASVSLLAAAQAPERVRALVMFEPVILPPDAIARAMGGESFYGPMAERTLKRRAAFPDRQAAFAAYHGRTSFKNWSDAMLADYVADGFRERADGQVELSCSPQWEANSYAAQANDVWTALRRSTCPIRVFKGEHSSTCSLDAAQAAEIGPGRIDVQLIAGASHFLPMERPDVVQAALRAAAL